jgi:hypothetical protein
MTMIESNFPVEVWNVWAPSRYKLFLWLMLQNQVWTANRLLQRNGQTNTFARYASVTWRWWLTCLLSVRWRDKYGWR